MRKLLLSTSALLLLAMPVLAQPHSDRGDEHSNRSEEHSNRVGKASVAPQVQDRAQAELRGQAQPQGAGNGRGEHMPAAQNAIQAPASHDDRGDRRGRGAAPAAQATIQSPPNRGDRGNWQGRGDRNDRGFRPGGDNANGRDFNRDGRTDYRSNFQSRAGGPRHDFSGFRDYHRTFHAQRRFRADFYRRPAGWYDHRWVYGEFLPAAFWARDYWIVDFRDYDLPPPPYGAVWVRVGSDALLIDEDSGEVITVAYDVFY